MSEHLKYQPLPVRSKRDEIERLLAEGDKSELLLLSLSVGESFPDWKFAQDVCLKLAEDQEPDVRANACLGLAYVARTKGRLEKHLVKPVLLRELRSQTEFRWRVEDAIDDINQFMGWHLAHKRNA